LIANNKKEISNMTAKKDLNSAIAELSSTFGGKLLKSGDVGYDDARRVHNGLIDKHPALIARCVGVADIVAAVTLARAQDLEVAVRGGGHNVAGRATVEGGIMIDLSLMKGIHVDAKASKARAQGGVTWNEFNRETQIHGLACTGGVVSSTGVAGLTLGGGLGWLMGRHGLALDNLVSAEVVTADGKVLNASAEENADLFWALRGGGGNFGVVASFEFRLHPIGPMVTGGLVAYPFDRAKEVLNRYREVTAKTPDDMTVVAGLIHAGDGSGAKLAAMATGHCGSAKAAEIDLAAVRSLPNPALDSIGPIPYSQLNSMLDGAYPKGALNYWKSSFLAELSDQAIACMIACFGKCPTPMGQLLLEHFHGEVSRRPIAETAFAYRATGYNFLILAEWMDASITEQCIAWARETFAAMKPFMANTRYVNYLGDDEALEAVGAAYGPNYRRLQQIKAKYDPANFFHMNQNIRPST
jgi:FAD/FMN-containing dehydrogenase